MAQKTHANQPDPRVQVQSADFSQDEVYQSLRDDFGADVGAVVTFVGLVRDRHGGAAADSVETLTLEHYPGMTEASITKILDKAEQRWPLLATRVIHRVGTMQPAEQIVLVAVASSHRDAAFAGAEFIMDYLKTDAVFWKREVAAGEDVWVQSTAADHQRAGNWEQKS